jgi:hypothetical protein
MHPFFYVYTHRASITNSTKYIKVGGVITSTPGGLRKVELIMIEGIEGY